MAKVSRNAPCPCGSGKKHKRCCLNSLPPPALSLTQELDQLIGGQVNDVYRRRSELAQRILSAAREKDTWRTTEFDATRVELLLEELRALAGSLLKAHGRQYWYQIVRRAPPRLGLGNEAILGASEIALACAPFDEADDWHYGDSGSGMRYKLDSDLAQSVLDLLCMGAIKRECEGLFRVASKGVAIFGGSDFEPISFTRTPSIESYERRRDSLETVAGSAGLWFDPSEVTAARPELCTYWGVGESQATLRLRSNAPPIDNSIRFLPLRHNDLPFDSLLSEFSEVFRRVTEIEVEQLTCFLYALSHMIYTVLRWPHLKTKGQSIWIHWSEDIDLQTRTVFSSHWLDMATMGFLRASEEAWTSRLWGDYQSVREFLPSLPMLSMKDFRLILRRLSLAEPFQLSEARLCLFTRISEQTVILDLLRSGDFFYKLFLKVHEFGTGRRDIAGPWLERQAKNFFIRELNLKPDSVVANRITDKTGHRRDVDIAFVYKDVLFVIECKAMAKDYAYIAGQHRRIRNHVTTIAGALSDCQERISFIRNGAIGGKIRPAEFSEAFALVCTSAVEYLPLEEERFWFEGSPLAGPPHEILETIKRIAAKCSA